MKNKKRLGSIIILLAIVISYYFLITKGFTDNILHPIENISGNQNEFLIQLAYLSLFVFIQQTIAISIASESVKGFWRTWKLMTGTYLICGTSILLCFIILLDASASKDTALMGAVAISIILQFWNVILAILAPIQIIKYGLIQKRK